MWDGILVTLPAAFFCLFVGNWSDYHGRKWLLILPFVGNILSYVAYILNYYFFEELGTDHLLWGSVLGLFGAYQCLNMGLFGYVADVTSETDRTMRLSVLNGVFSLGYVIGTTSGSLLFKYVGDYYIIFGISILIGLLGIAYTALLVKESVHSTPESRAEHKLLDVDNVKECLRTAFKQRPNNGRIRIIILILNFAVFMFCLNTSRYDYQLTINKFDWTITEYSNYLSFQRICRMLSLFVLLPIISRIFKINDSLIAATFTFFTMVAYLLIAIGQHGWIMFVSAALQLNSMITVIIRSQCTKSVEKEETGRIFAVVAFGQALVPLVSNPLFGLLYQATLDTFPGAYLIVVDVLLFMAFLSSLYLYIDDRRQRHEQVIASNLSENDKVIS